MASVLEKCEQFVKMAVLPELLGKWYSKEPIKKPEPSNTDVEENNKDQTGDTDQTVLLWCYCRKEESGEMITCDNTECHILHELPPHHKNSKGKRENGFVPIAVNRKRTPHIHNNYIINNFYSIETTESQQLHNAQQIVTTLSITLMSSWGVHIIKLTGRVDSKMVNFCLTTPMTLSTSIRMRDNCQYE